MHNFGFDVPKAHASMIGTSWGFTSGRLSAAPIGRVLIPPTTPRSIPSPHDEEVGRVRERGFQKSATIRWNEPLSPALSPLVPRREREQKTSAMVVVSSCARLGTGNRVRFVQKACDGYTAK